MVETDAANRADLPVQPKMFAANFLRQARESNRVA